MEPWRDGLGREGQSIPIPMTIKWRPRSVDGRGMRAGAAPPINPQLLVRSLDAFLAKGVGGKLDRYLALQNVDARIKLKRLYPQFE